MHNHLACSQRINHLPRLAILLSCDMSNYTYSNIASVSSKEFHDIQTTAKFRFTLKRVRDIVRTCRQDFPFLFPELVTQSQIFCFSTSSNKLLESEKIKVCPSS